jgi:serine/threonine-protein kinase RsbW
VFIEKQIEASIENLALIEQLLDDLYGQGLIPEAFFGNIIVASTEAYLNAVNHGSRSDSEKLVNVQIDCTSDFFEIIVQDQGEGFDWNALPDPTDPANLEKGNGRGIFIMKNLADEIRFEERGTKVVMRFEFAGQMETGA